MEPEDFKKQEDRMERFMRWLRETVHYIRDMSQDEYEVIFYKIGDKAKNI